jgi:hypothetical protein
MYESREYHPNFEKFLALLSSSMVKYKLLYNSNTIVEAMSNYKMPSTKVDEALEYCANKGYIHKRDYNFYLKGIAKSGI